MPLAAVLVGTAVPDLIDKPLGAVTPLALQSVGHSLVGVAVVALLVARTRLPWGVLFGWVGHLAADVVQLTANARGDHATRVLSWPASRVEPFVLADSPAPRLAVLDPLAAVATRVPVPLLQDGYLAYYVTTPGLLADCAVWLAAGVVVVWRRR